VGLGRLCYIVNKKTNNYLSNIASKSRLAITYPKPTPIPIDKPLTTVITYEEKYPKSIPIILRPCINKKAVTITKVIIIDRIIKEINVIRIIFFFSILHQKDNRSFYYNIFGGNKKTSDYLINNIQKKSRCFPIRIILFIPRAVETTIVFIITMASSSNFLNYKPTCTSKFSFINHAFISNFLGTFQEFPAILRLIFFGCSCHKQIEYHLFHINIFGGKKKSSDYLIISSFYGSNCVYKCHLKMRRIQKLQNKKLQFLLTKYKIETSQSKIKSKLAKKNLVYPVSPSIPDNQQTFWSKYRYYLNNIFAGKKKTSDYLTNSSSPYENNHYRIYQWIFAFHVALAFPCFHDVGNKLLKIMLLKYKKLQEILLELLYQLFASLQSKRILQMGFHILILETNQIDNLLKMLKTHLLLYNPYVWHNSSNYINNLWEVLFVAEKQY
jgi:hypothetical protein